MSISKTHTQKSDSAIKFFNEMAALVKKHPLQKHDTPQFWEKFASASECLSKYTPKKLCTKWKHYLEYYTQKKSTKIKTKNIPSKTQSTQKSKTSPDRNRPISQSANISGKVTRKVMGIKCNYDLTTLLKGSKPSKLVPIALRIQEAYLQKYPLTDEILLLSENMVFQFDIKAEERSIIMTPSNLQKGEHLKFPQIWKKLKVISDLYKKPMKEVEILFKQTNCNIEVLEDAFLKNTISKDLWNSKEDKILKSLLQNKTCKQIDERAKFLKLI